MGLKKDITCFAVSTLVAAVIARWISQQVKQDTIRAVKSENERNRDSIIEYMNGRNLYDQVRTIRLSGQKISGVTSETNDYDDGTP